MTKRRSLKRALFSSMMSIILCFTMLLGTTFAWFTDSAVSGNNIIKAGNLDMELSYKPYGAEHTEWNKVENDTVLFGKDALYEPGYTEAVWLKVENLGSLAFRYDLAVNVASEKPGTNKDGETFNLSDSLEVKYLTTTSTDMESNFYTTRESLDSFAWGSAVNSGVASLKDEVAVIKNGVAYSKDDAANGAYNSAYVLVVISMPTTVGNEANHNGTDIPQIDFSLTALATQLAYEEDSFGSDYDVDSEYKEPADLWDGTVDTVWYNETDTEFILTTAEEFAGFASLVNGGNTFAGKTVKLGNDVDLNQKTWTPIGSWNTSVFSGTLDGQEHVISNLTIEKTNTSGTERLGLFGYIKNAVIQDLTVENANISADANIARGAVLVMCADGSSNTISGIAIEDSSVTMESVDESYACGVVAWANAGTSMVMSDISVSGLALTASQTGNSSAKVAPILGYLYNADGKASSLDTFEVNNIAIDVDAPKAIVGGALGDTNKGKLTVSNGTVNNVAMDVSGTGEHDLGGLIGYTYKVDHLTVENVAVTGLDIDFAGNSSKVGGVTGRDQSVSDYKNVTVSGTINENIATGSGSEVGGFVGISYYYPKTYEECSASVDVVTGGVAGGFVGTSCTNGWANQTDAYTTCSASGDVTADVAGGFAGKAWLTNNTTMAMINVESSGAVAGKIHAGGMIGYAAKANNNVVIKDSAASQSVVGTGSSATVGGIVGTGNANWSFENVTAYVTPDVG